MMRPFIYSWILICPVLGSEAFDKNLQIGKTQSSKKNDLFLFYKFFLSVGDYNSLTQRIHIKIMAPD